jgi:NhaP-type Na+/H+ or K+/H+ antiporter
MAVYDRPTRWQERREVLSGVFHMLFLAAVAVGIVAGVYFFYPFVPIGDVPLSELTLKQIATDLSGALLLIVIPIHFGFGLRSAFVDLTNRQRQAVEMLLVVAILSVVGVCFVAYWLVPLLRWLQSF